MNLVNGALTEGRFSRRLNVDDDMILRVDLIVAISMCMSTGSRFSSMLYASPATRADRMEQQNQR